ncbi:MAG TPA: FliM/FliN family flagellar motor C-terminal domain-containing protein [Burkholderiaceae bacterium]
MPALLYRVLRPRDLAALEQRLAAAARLWLDGWGIAADAVVCTAPACGQPRAAGDWLRYREESGAVLGLLHEAPAQPAIAALLFGGASGTSRLAPGVAAEAHADLTAMLLAALAPDGAHAAGALTAVELAALTARGAASALAVLTLPNLVMQWLVPAALVPWQAAPASAAPPRTPLRDALRALPVALTVEIGDADITVGHLRTLAAGDVIALNSRLDQPLHVLGPGRDTVLCHAHLGRQQDLRAIELIPTTKASS